MSGVELRGWRQARALRQEDVARALGIGLRTYVRWEHMPAIPLGDVVQLALVGLDVRAGRPIDRPDTVEGRE